MTRLVADALRDPIATAGFEVSANPTYVSAGVAAAADVTLVALLALFVTVVSCA